MNNKQSREYFDGQMYGAYIDKLFWLAGIGDDWRDVNDMLEHLDEEEFKEVFPDFDGGEYTDFFINAEKFGLVAEIHHPRCYNFRYSPKGYPESWSVSAGTCHISYVYAETLSGLRKAIEKFSYKEFRWYMKKDKESNKPKVIDITSTNLPQ